MTVNKLDGNRVLIVLDSADLSELSLAAGEPDFSDERQRGAIFYLSRSACRRFGIETGGKSVSVEALPLDCCWYLLVTVRRRARVYRRRKPSPLCCRFDGSDELMTAAEKLCRMGFCCEKAAVYYHGGSYFLLLDCPVYPRAALHLLSEFGALSRSGVLCAKIAETAKPVCACDAIRKIGKPAVYNANVRRRS